MKLLGIYKINYKLVVLTGIHIGGISEGLEIGGIDNPVIKDVYGQPYIPASSLKGKIRSLLEITRSCDDGKTCAESNGGEPCGCGKCDICVLFGSSDAKKTYTISRLIFRDSYIENQSFKLLQSIYEPVTELKVENRINRITATTSSAKGGGLRKTERVPAGAVFQGEINYVFIDHSDKQNDESVKVETDVERSGNGVIPRRIRVLFEGMKLLTQSYLGGSGSRGYGRVAFAEVSIDAIPASEFGGDRDVKIAEIKLGEEPFQDFKDFTKSVVEVLKDARLDYVVELISERQKLALKP